MLLRRLECFLGRQNIHIKDVYSYECLGNMDLILERIEIPYRLYLITDFYICYALPSGSFRHEHINIYKTDKLYNPIYDSYLKFLKEGELEYILPYSQKNPAVTYTNDLYKFSNM